MRWRMRNRSTLALWIRCAVSMSPFTERCSIEEHVMHTAAGFWQRGQKVWRVLHRGGTHGVMGLVVDGSPPPAFETLRSRKFALQAADTDVDHIFDILFELARSIVGFRNDELSSGIDYTDFRALQLESNGLLGQVTPQVERPSGPSDPIEVEVLGCADGSPARIAAWGQARRALAPPRKVSS